MKLTAVLENIPKKLLEALQKVQADLGTSVYVVGGFVRDALLNKPCKDIDFLILETDPYEFTERVAKLLDIQQIHYFKHFGTCMFRYQQMDIEFVRARKESYQQDSRKPQVESGTLEEDLSRRDFTINALALSLGAKNFGECIDLFSGIQDLESGILKTPLKPEITYSDDPLRMMRAIRFATQLNFRIEPENWTSICTQKERLKIISQERITEELQKIMMADQPSIGLKLLFDSGLLAQFFPELVALQGVDYVDGKGHKDNFYHTLQVVDNLVQQKAELWLRWAGLLHDIAKPLTKKFEPANGWTFHGHEEKGAIMVPKIFKKLRLPLDTKMRYVQKLVRLHLRPIALVKTEVTDSAARRLLFEAGEDFDDLMQLCFADITSKNEEKVERIKRNFNRVYQWIREVEEQDHVKNFQPPIDGKEIMCIFALRPCKEIGMIKTSIKNAILDGEIPNTRQAAYHLMLKKGLELGLIPKKQQIL